jgi:hypothetical protein
MLRKVVLITVRTRISSLTTSVHYDISTCAIYRRERIIRCDKL